MGYQTVINQAGNARIKRFGVTTLALLSPGQLVLAPLSHARGTGAAGAAADVFADELGFVDRILVLAGVRVAVLRWMDHATRMRLFREAVVRREAFPKGSRTCWEGAQVWLDAVRELVAVQQWQPRRRDTWMAVAKLLADSAREGMRPLTEISHAKLAERLGVSERYVHTITRWLIEHRLLGQLLSGTRFAPLEVPQDETSEEATARLARAEAAETARRDQRVHALTQARAELDAVRDGRPVPPTDLAPYREYRAAQHDGPGDLVNLASVYELRVPAEDAEEYPRPHPVPAPQSAGVASLAEARENRADPEPGDIALTSTNNPTPKKFYPYSRRELKQLTPEAERAVDKNRRAPRGSDKRVALSEGRGGLNGASTSLGAVGRLPIALRAAQALLQGPVPGGCDDDTTLPPALTRGVTRTWLARRIRPLTDAGWDPLEIAWHIVTRGGQHDYLPTRITNPAGFIVGSLRTAIPAVRPTAKWAADLAEHEHRQLSADREHNVRDLAAHRRRRHAEHQRADAIARRAAIHACDLCDDHGWLDIPDTPEIGAVRCNHDPDTSGW